MADLRIDRKPWGGWPFASPDPELDKRRCRCARCAKADKREKWGWYQLVLFPELAE